VLEIQEQGETQIGNREVANHLGYMSGGEILGDLWVHDYQPIHDEIRDERVHDHSFITDIETA
jgi:hypothetical protein